MEKEKIEIRDEFNFICNKNYSKVVKKDETLYWSGECLKINKVDKRQNRVFLITSKRVVNIGNQTNFFSKIFSKLVKRQLYIDKICAITYSMISNNFVLHLPSEYDYFLCTSKKDDFIETITKIKQNNKEDPLKFYLIEEIDLNKFSKKEGEELERYPSVVPKKMNAK